MKKIAFIGAGNMNGAIISGMVKKVAPENIIVTNPSPEKRIKLAEELGINQSNDNIKAADFADIIVLGVKPYLIAQVCQQIAQQIDVSNKCFISVAAGTTVAQIQQALGGNTPVIRVMPNTPSQIGLGVSGMYPSKEVTSEQKQIADQLLSSVGIVKWLNEEHEIDHIIAVSGSAPAYFFLFMEAMQAKAIALGFSEQDSRELVQQTALGAAQMVVNNDISIGQLRENVTSKGGTTQAALNALNDGNLSALVASAMDAAIARAVEMANE